MSSIKTGHPLALKILMTEDIYGLKEEQSTAPEKEFKAAPQIVQTPGKKSEESPVFNYLGENNKYFLILVAEDKSEIISKQDLEALTSILAAKKMELRDVAVLNYRKYAGTAFNDLKSFFACSKCVLLGINPRDLGLNDVAGNKITEVNGVKTLASFSFSEMQADLNKKRAFWNEMKQL